jgi:hypothetical protein
MAPEGGQVYININRTISALNSQNSQYAAPTSYPGSFLFPPRGEEERAWVRQRVKDSFRLREFIRANKMQHDWLATNNDVITTQSHSFFACSRQKVAK